MTDSLLFQIQMSEHNSLLCGGPQYTDNPQNIFEGVITNALQSCKQEQEAQ